jgi:hypothetical protein
MNEPVGQHIVPVCYLQNFAVEKRKDKYFVDVLFNQSADKKIQRLNVRNICKIRDFYTFDDLPETEKRWLERYYSHHIESNYHDIYKALTDPEVETISEVLKTKVLVHIISQELRTPKLAEALNSIMNRTIEYAFLAHEQLGTQKKIFSEGGEVMDFEGKTMEQAINEDNNKNRQSANLEAVKRLKRIVELKSNCHIMVVKYDESIGLISSDRPVYTSTPLYSPDCKIDLPINRNHMICIIPFDEEIEPDHLKIVRLDHAPNNGRLAVTVYNMFQVEKADRFLYGDKVDIVESLKSYEALNARNS